MAYLQILASLDTAGRAGESNRKTVELMLFSDKRIRQYLNLEGLTSKLALKIIQSIALASK